jgi:DNA repair exonuclease SbcCD ATPase subunit
MFIHRLSVNSFKPFKSLGVTIEDTPRLVVACGQNGTGKSSLIDAISLWRQQRIFGNSDPRYYARGGLDENTPVGLTFHWHGDGEPNPAQRRPRSVCPTRECGFHRRWRGKTHRHS